MRTGVSQLEHSFLQVTDLVLAFYKHRSNNLVDKNGKEIGKCYTQTDKGKYFCNHGPGVIYGGFKRLYCQTSKTIDDIRA